MNLTPLLDLPKAIDLIEEAHRQQARGQIVPHAPYHIRVGEHSGLRVVSGALLEPRRVGVRLGPNSGLGGGNKMYASVVRCRFRRAVVVHGISIWHAREPRRSLRLPRSTWRAKIRTAWGCSASGRNAFGILKGLLSVRPIKEIFVSSRDPERRKNFCAEGEKLLGITVRGVDTPEQAVRGMDVILTATNSLTPIFPEEWVDPGTHVSSMGKPTELSRGLHLKRRSNRRRQPRAGAQLRRSFSGAAAGRTHRRRKAILEPDPGIGRACHRRSAGQSQPRRNQYLS